LNNLAENGVLLKSEGLKAKVRQGIEESEFEVPAIQELANALAKLVA